MPDETKIGLPPSDHVQQFGDGNHALKAGYLIGHLMSRDVSVRPVMNGPDYTPTLIITIPVDQYGYESIQVEVRVLP